jgi:hypothetical protein
MIPILSFPTTTLVPGKRYCWMPELPHNSYAKVKNGEVSHSMFENELPENHRTHSRQGRVVCGRKSYRAAIYPIDVLATAGTQERTWPRRSP